MRHVVSSQSKHHVMGKFVLANHLHEVRRSAYCQKGARVPMLLYHLNQMLFQYFVKVGTFPTDLPSAVECRALQLMVNKKFRILDRRLWIYFRPEQSYGWKQISDAIG